MGRRRLEPGMELDDARAATTYDRMVPPASFTDYRKWVALHMEVLNDAIAGLPPERIRYHVCWGSWPGPHTTDVPLKDIVDLILRPPSQRCPYCRKQILEKHWRKQILPK